MGQDEHSMRGLLERIEDDAAASDTTSIADLLELLGARGFGPLIAIFALIEISPVGGIPGVPTFLATVILLIAGQVVLGRDHLWLPGVIEDRNVSGDRLKSALKRMHPVADRMDRWFKARARALTRPAVIRIAATVVCLLCVTVPPLEIIPFASTIPMAAIAVLGIAIFVRDGYLLAGGFVAAAAAFCGGLYLLLTT